MSDTPETDHLEVQLGQAATHSHPILWEHSRKMERERNEARDAIVGWENKWKCAIDMAARAELERDEALKCAKEYYVEFIRNASSDNKISKPNPLNPFYKY